MVAAHDRLDVREALAQLDQAVRGDAAGFLTYEAAGAFGLPVQQSAPGLPLLCFGLFSPEQVEPLNRFPAVGGTSLQARLTSIDLSRMR